MSGNYAADPVIMNDALHESDMVDASRALLARIRYARGEDVDETDLRWRPNRRANRFPPPPFECVSGGHNARSAAAAVQRLQWERTFVDTLRTPNREPCPSCGTRADIGCKHTISKGEYQ